MVLIENGGKEYRIVFGSDASDGHNGVYPELQEPEHRGIVGAYWSDLDGSFTFFAEKIQLPFVVIEAFMREARDRSQQIKEYCLSCLRNRINFQFPEFLIAQFATRLVRDASIHENRQFKRLLCGLSF